MTITPTGDLEGALAAFGVQAGPQAGDEVPIRNRAVRIGRGPSNEVVIDDDSVSGSHARLDWDTGARAWRLTDLGSTNGTFVEGVRLAVHVPTPLPLGTSVRFGAVRLHFRAAYVEDLPSQATAASSPAASPVAPSAPASPAQRKAQLRTGAIVGGALLAAALALFGIQQLTRDDGAAGARGPAAAGVRGGEQGGDEPARPRLPVPSEPTPESEPIRIPPPVQLDAA